MIIKKEKYCIASKSMPLLFYDNEGYAYDDFDSNAGYILRDDKFECERELETYDEPEKFQIIKINATYEL